MSLALWTCLAKEEETNEIAAPQPPINLDANLRRALLKALTELENEEREQNSTSVLDDKIFEKASASAVSFFAGPSSTTGTPTSTTTTTTETPTTTERQIIIVQKSDGIQHPSQISVVENSDTSDDDEQILTSASSSFSQEKYSFTKSDNQIQNSIGGEKTNLLTEVEKPIVKTTTPTPKKNVTTTQATTVVPTEESEAKVEDVQFFSAPLVAAFTVHQDERGVPKSVVPIFKPVTNQATTKQLESESQKQLLQQQEFLRQQEQLRNQDLLQEKQRALEDEVFRLQQQQQHQDYILRQQQLFQDQQLQVQRQRLLEQQTRLLRGQQQPFAAPSIQHNHISNEIRPNSSKHRGTLVAVQPSVTLSPVPVNVVSSLPINAQQLPIKNAGNFHLNNFVHQQPLPAFNTFVQQPITSFQPVVNLVSTSPPLTRNFRHETQTGNFFNNNYNFVRPVQQNRYFRNSLEGTQTFPFRVQAPVVNQQLNNLLYQSGIVRGRQQEDLNIVSKVLSLNHLGGDQFFSASGINEQRVPILKKSDKDI